MYDDYMFYVAPERFQNMVKPAAHVYFRKVANKATEIIGPSLKVVEFLRRCGVERHINIIPNTVDLSDFMPENVSRDDVAAIRTKLGIRDGDTAMCFVGRLGKEKSIDVLVEFFAAHFRGDDAYKLFIIGDGPEKENLERQIARLGVAMGGHQETFAGLPVSVIWWLPVPACIPEIEDLEFWSVRECRYNRHSNRWVWW